MSGTGTSVGNALPKNGVCINDEMRDSKEREIKAMAKAKVYAAGLEYIMHRIPLRLQCRPCTAVSARSRLPGAHRQAADLLSRAATEVAVCARSVDFAIQAMPALVVLAWL